MALGKEPPDLIWSWVTKGFDGLFSLIDRWLAEGVPPTDRLIHELTIKRDKINALLDKLKDHG